jgi:hypothetical protein
MMAAGTRASNSHEALTQAPKLGTADRDGRIGDDAAFSMSYVQAMAVARRRSHHRQSDSARMTQEQQSSASGALLAELQCKIIRQEEAQ